MFQGFLNSYFSCCSFCQKSQDDEIEREEVIDETTRLIPTTAEPPPSTPTLIYVDHEQLRERLGTIVRAKEGKMVNVIKRTHFKNRTETRFDTLGHAAGRVHTTLPRTHHHNTESESEASVLEDGIRGENGPIKTQTPSSSLQDMFIPQPDAKLSLSWED